MVTDEQLASNFPSMEDRRDSSRELSCEIPGILIVWETGVDESIFPATATDFAAALYFRDRVVRRIHREIFATTLQQFDPYTMQRFLHYRLPG
ncbi:hypothetical protein IC582_012889 [Cucumis melo]